MANVVTFNPILASWLNAIPSQNVRTYDQNTDNPLARWGGYSSPSTPSDNDSGYDFQADPVPLNVTVAPNSTSGLFDLGDFTHHNRPIPSGTSITSIDLKLTTGVFVDGFDLGLKNFVFQFVHDETPNGDNPCKYGGANNQGVNVNGCADRVSTNWLTTSDSFSIGGIDYTLKIMGFMVGTDEFSSFLTKESFENVATLRAEVITRKQAEDENLPEPGSLALMGLGLASLALVYRWRRST
jgi:hypothetical protein